MEATSSPICADLATHGLLTSWRELLLPDGWPLGTWFLLPRTASRSIALPRLTGFTELDETLARRLAREGSDPQVTFPQTITTSTVFAPPRAADIRRGLRGEPIEVPVANVQKALSGERDNGRRPNADLDETLELLRRIDLDGEAQGAVLAEDPWTDPDEAKKRLRRTRRLLVDHGVLPWAALPPRRLPADWAADASVHVALEQWWAEAEARARALRWLRSVSAA